MALLYFLANHGSPDAQHCLTPNQETPWNFWNITPDVNLGKISCTCVNTTYSTTPSFCDIEELKYSAGVSTPYGSVFGV